MRFKYSDIIILLTILINIALCYILLWNPYSLLFSDKNQPYNLPDENHFSYLIAYATIGIVVFSTIILVYYFLKRQKLFIYSPLLSLLVIVSIIIASKYGPKYPSSISTEVHDDYTYIVEIWWNQPDNKRVYKRWKSNEQNNTNNKFYILDSISISAEK
jgi:Na+-driven multidrug efflux pump